MDFKTYQAAALRTESRPDTLNFGPKGLHLLLTLAIDCATLLDSAKKTIFYGRPLPDESTRELARRIAKNADLIAAAGSVIADHQDASFSEELQKAEAKNIDLRILHAALGIFTEGGEILECARAMLETGKLDRVNWGEELGGDVSWFQALGHDAAGTDEEEERAKNLAKLQARYPEKFTNQNALVRDLAAERAILEGKNPDSAESA